MLGSLFAGTAAGLAVAVPLGAIGVMIVELGARWGFTAAFRAGLGTAICDGAYAALAAAAGTAVARALDGAQRVLTIVAAVVLAAVGLHLLRGARRLAVRRAAPTDRAPRHLTVRFLALTAINPLTAVVFAGLIAGDPGTAPGPASAVLFVAGAFGASLAWQSVLAGAGAVAHRRMTASAAPWTRAAGGAIVLALAARTALGAW